MEIHTSPIARPDETLYSVAARIRLANAAINDRDACRSLFGLWPNMRVSDFPVHLPHFCAATQNIFGDPPTVLQDRTLALFFERIGCHPWRKGSRPDPIDHAGYGLATLSNGSTGRWRVCLRCMKSDLASHATSIWRRAHHLPTSFVCPIHGSLLTVAMPSRLELGKRFVLPEQTIGRTAIGGKELTSNQMDLVRLTTLGIDVLEDRHPPATIGNNRSTLFSGLANRGLLTATGKLRRVQFVEEINHRYGFLARHPDYAAALSSKGIDILQRNLLHPEGPLSAVHNLLLIDWLFGTWEAFQQRCMWETTMNDFTPFDRTLQQNAIKDHHRQTCLDFISAESVATRSRFFRAAPTSLRWLLRYDDDWLNTCLPIMRKRRTQSKLF